MAAGRMLLTLTFIAVGLLGAALALSAGGGSSLTTILQQFAPFSIWPSGDGAAAAGAPAPARSEAFALLVGFLAGWWLRWLYGLPWSSLPAAVGAWLLGWRASAAMAGLAIGCTVILLFY
jgi:hypothetical protein